MSEWTCTNCGATLCYFENCHTCGATCNECARQSAVEQARNIKRETAEARDRKVAAQLDGHYCYDWDGLAVSAWTPEYDCCVDFKKSLRGRIVNWFFMKWFYHMEAKVRAQAGTATEYPLECCGKYIKDCTCK